MIYYHTGNGNKSITYMKKDDSIPKKGLFATKIISFSDETNLCLFYK